MLYGSCHIDLMFRALADPTRRALMERLSRGAAPVSELAKALAMSLPAVTQHVRILEASGLVRSLKFGRVRNCRIEPKALTLVERWINERRMSWEHRFDCAYEHVVDPDANPRE